MRMHFPVFDGRFLQLYGCATFPSSSNGTVKTHPTRLLFCGIRLAIEGAMLLQGPNPATCIAPSLAMVKRLRRPPASEFGLAYVSDPLLNDASLRALRSRLKPNLDSANTR
jgi:hypothetical protein